MNQPVQQDSRPHGPGPPAFGRLRAAIDWLDAALMYDIHKLSKTATIGENFGSFVANYVISEKRWQSLPAAVQKELSAMGEEIARSTCAQVERDEAGEIEKVKQAGVQMVTLSVADKALVATAMQEVVKDWADNLDRRGRSGTEVLDAFKAGLK